MVLVRSREEGGGEGRVRCLCPLATVDKHSKLTPRSCAPRGPRLSRQHTAAAIVEEFTISAQGLEWGSMCKYPQWSKQQ